MKVFLVFVLCYLHYSKSKGIALPETLERGLHKVESSIVLQRTIRSPRNPQYTVSPSDLQQIIGKVQHIEKFTDDIQKKIKLLNLTDLANIDITSLFILTGIKGRWKFDKLILRDYCNWERQPSAVEQVKTDDGEGVKITTSFYWPAYVCVDIEQNGEVRFIREHKADLVIKSENSKMSGAIKGFRVTFTTFLFSGHSDISIVTEYDEYVNAGISGVSLNGMAIGHFEKFIHENVIPFFTDDQVSTRSSIPNPNPNTATVLLRLIAKYIQKKMRWDDIDIDIEGFLNMDMNNFDKNMDKAYKFIMKYLPMIMRS